MLCRLKSVNHRVCTKAAFDRCVTVPRLSLYFKNEQLGDNWSMKPLVVVAMPQFNESGTLSNFLLALKTAFDEIDNIETRFVVVDDCSTDDSIRHLNELTAQAFPLTIIRNEENLGHGPSTIRALKAALLFNPEIVVSIDGDAQFSAPDVAAIVSRGRNHSNAITECHRINRKEPLFRKATSFSTRIILLLRTHKYIADPNTPLRVYKSCILRQILAVIPDSSLIPNLRISVITRELTNSIGTSKISFLAKDKASPSTMFGQNKVRSLPSRRFLKFCLAATKEWILSSKYFDKGTN